MEALYQFGNYKIYKNFDTPTLDKFQQWRLEFLSKNNLDNYSLLFMGNSAERIFGQSELHTTDVDIVISSDSTNYLDISKILHSAFQTGLAYNLLIDIYHINVDVLANGGFGKYYAIRFYKEIIINKQPIPVWSTTNIDNLPMGLYGTHRFDIETKSYQKYLHRIDEGHYLGLKFNLKTMELISYN